jgi:hypothetical protein
MPSSVPTWPVGVQAALPDGSNRVIQTPYTFSLPTAGPDHAPERAPQPPRDQDGAGAIGGRGGRGYVGLWLDRQARSSCLTSLAAPPDRKCEP